LAKQLKWNIFDCLRYTKLKTPTVPLAKIKIIVIHETLHGKMRLESQSQSQWGAARSTATVAGHVCFASCNIHPMSKNNVVESQERQTSSNQRENVKDFRISNVLF